MSACCPTCGLAAPSSQAVGLTPKQREVLRFLEACSARGESPSYREIADAVGLASKGRVWRLVALLRERGHLQHNSNSRSIVVIGMPPEACA